MNRVTIALLFAPALLAACQDKSCTADDLSEKATALMVVAQSFGAANPDRMADVGGRVADLVDQSQHATGDLQPLCQAIDGLIAEIGG